MAWLWSLGSRILAPEKTWLQRSAPGVSFIEWAQELGFVGLALHAWLWRSREPALVDLTLQTCAHLYLQADTSPAICAAPAQEGNWCREILRQKYWMQLALERRRSRGTGWTEFKHSSIIIKP